MDINKQLEEYSNSEEMVYQRWYIKHTAENLGLDEDVDFKSLPSLDEIKESFNNWYKLNKNRLKSLICDKFKYSEKRDSYTTIAELTKAIAELIDPDYVASLEIAHILVEQGLDTLCQA